MVKIFRVSVNHFMVDNSFVTASGMVYITLTALIPALTVFVTFFGALGVLEPFQKMLMVSLNEFFGSDVSKQFFDAVSGYTSNAMSLGIVGLVSFIITMVLLINRVWYVINSVFRTSIDRNLFQRFGNFLSFLIVSILILAAIISIESSLSQKYVQVMGRQMVSGPFLYLKQITPFFLIWVGLFLMIEFIPNTKVEFSAAAIGALVGSIVCVCANSIFLNLTSYMVNMSIIYGSFAAIFLFIVWCYMLWVIILFSVELAYVYQFRPDLENSTGIQNTPARFLSDGVNIMMLIGYNFKEGKGATRTREINERLAIPDRKLFGYLNFLVSLGFIMPTNSGKTTYIPARPLEDLKVKEMVEGLYGLDTMSFDDKGTAGEAIAVQIHGHGVASLGTLTIDNLLQRV
jgi:membrane protein